jgi:RNA polymerase sigma factor (sigma-70 family)
MYPIAPRPQIDAAAHLGLARSAAGGWVKRSALARRLGFDFLFAEASYALCVVCRCTGYDPARPFALYALRSIDRHIRKVLERERRRGLFMPPSPRHAPEPTWGGLGEVAGHDGANADDRLDAAALRDVVETLPPRQQEVLRLRVEERLTLRETGDRLGRSYESVRQDERSALRAVRDRCGVADEAFTTGRPDIAGAV